MKRTLFASLLIFLGCVLAGAGLLFSAEGEAPPAKKKPGAGKTPAKKKPLPAEGETPPAKKKKPPAEPAEPATPAAEPAEPAEPAVPADAEGWTPFVFDEALACFEKSKGKFTVEGGNLVIKSSGGTKISYSAATKAQFGDVELSAKVQFEGTGMLKLRLRYNPKGAVPACYELNVKPTKGKTSTVTLKVLGGKATGTIDGVDAGAQVKTAGTPPAQGPIQIFVGGTDVNIVISEMKTRPATAGGEAAPPAETPPAAEPPAPEPLDSQGLA